MYVVRILTLICFVSPSLCANILGLFPAKFKSHFIMFDSIMSELARRGHNVTVVSPFPKPKLMGNFTDIDISICDELPLDDVFEMEQAYKEFNPIKCTGVIFDLAKYLEPIVQCENLQQLVKSKQSFDLVITEIFHSDLMLALVEKFKAPHISFVAYPLFPWSADRMGNPSNPSYIRFPLSDHPLHQKTPTFYQRFLNIVYYIHGQFEHYRTNLLAEEMARKYFNSKTSISEIAKNTSLILSFSHFTINAPVPLLPNVIEISGVQIKPAAPLPKDIQKFIEESEHGVIYFSMGSLLKMDTIPDKKRIAFLDAFAKVPQRILWKWGANELPGKTDKIFASSWMPQRDILAHPKVKLFIAHGGALGMNEAVYEGVPVLGIPMYADQVTNLEVLRSYGGAEILHYSDITNETVLTSIRQVLKKKYSENMKKVSVLFKDRPLSAMDTAIYWIEYVIRHKGAYHLRSIAADMPLYQYFLIDIIGSVLVAILTLIICVYIAIKKFLSMVQPRNMDLKKKL